MIKWIARSIGQRRIELLKRQEILSVKPKKREVYELAVKLAQSGKLRNWQGIQKQLVEKGYKRAPDLLDNEKIRAVLDICCENSHPN